MKFINRLLYGSHIFVGIGACAGGLAAILNPDAPMGMPTEVLKNSPFSNYLIPGILLFGVIGLGNLFSAVTYYYKSKYQGYISSIFSWALVFFIIIQCLMLQVVAFLHILFFCIGLLQALLSFILLFDRNQFPASIARALYQKLLKQS